MTPHTFQTLAWWGGHQLKAVVFIVINPARLFKMSAFSIMKLKQEAEFTAKGPILSYRMLPFLIIMLPIMEEEPISVYILNLYLRMYLFRIILLIPGVEFIIQIRTRILKIQTFLSIRLFMVVVYIFKGTVPFLTA